MGGDHRQAQLNCKLRRGMQVMFFVGKSGALHLDVIAIVEQPRPFPRELPGLRGIARQQRAADIAEMRAGQAIRPSVSLMEPLAAQLGPAAMLVLQIGARQTAQQQVARAGLAQQQHAVGAVAIGIVADVHVAAGNRLDPLAARRLVELDQAEEIVQVGQRQCRHPVLPGRGHRLVHAHHSIRNGIFAVQAEMDESGLRHDEKLKWG